MATDLTTTAILKAWASPDLDSSRDAELALCVTRASVWVEEQSSWVIGTVTYTAKAFDGDEIRGPNLFLPTRHRYVATPSAITENGTALTIATGYDTSADVIATGLLDRNEQARLQRRGSWSAGLQNIAVTYVAGYAAGSIPADIEQLANEVAWIFFKAPMSIGRSTVTKAGHAATIDKALTPLSLMTLERLREAF